MTIRLRDAATLLEPDTSADSYTEEAAPDWDKDPVRELDVPFKGEPVSSSEELLTAQTIIARWKGYLPALIPDPTDASGATLLALADVVTSTWRVRWHGDVYTIDGDVEVHRKDDTVRYLSVILKRVK